MSYKVIARKYRPQTFSEVIGQNHITKTLENAILMNKVAHAYLFTGTRGVGKTTVARIFAKTVNCEQTKETEPCNKCKTCTEIINGSSTEVIEIDGASNRGIDEIRNLKESINYAPLHAKYKVYIIDEFHMLTTEAFNAFLKTLEEPPPHIIFILATTEPHRIPNTVISRCQRYDFRKISSKNIIERLKLISEREKINISDQSLLAITKEANGSMRDAESLLDQIITFSGGKVKDEDVLELLGKENRQNLLKIFTALLNKDTRCTIELINKLDFEGSDIQVSLKNLIELVKTAIEIHVSGMDSFAGEFSSEEINEIKNIIKGKNFEELDLIYEILSRAYESMGRSENPLLVCEIALIRATKISSLKSIDELLKNLKDIEKQIGLLPTTENEEKTWEGFLRYLNYRNPVIFSYLSLTKLISSDNVNIVVDTGPNPILKEKISDIQFITQIHSIAKDYYKKSIQITFKKSFAAVHEGKTDPSADSKIKSILNKFDGEIIDK